MIRNFYQFSYRIIKAENEEIGIYEIEDVLREINNEVRDLVWTGWSMFYPFNREGIQPLFTVDKDSGIGNEEFLQTSLLKDPHGRSGSQSDMWRVSCSGLVTILRDYWEDEPRYSQHASLPPRTWLNPDHLFRNITEFVRHARAYAGRFPSATSVQLKCEWIGLKDRILFNPDGGHWRERPPAHEDTRVSSLKVPVSAFQEDWPNIVAKLGSPVMRLFAPDFPIDGDWVRRRSIRWRSIAGG